MPRAVQSDAPEENPVPGNPQPVRLAARRLGCAGAVIILAAILALLAGFIFYRLEVASSRLISGGGAEVEKLVRDAFLAVTRMQPNVTVDEHVVIEQSSPVLELAVVESDLVVERETTATWLGSTKHIRLRAVYRVKSGFDLKQPFNVRILSGGASPAIKVEVPPAKLLSVEQVRFERFDLDSGLWNRVKPEELRGEIEALSQQARLKAAENGMQREAEATLADQLRQRIGPEHPLEISTSRGSPLPSPAKSLP